MVEYPERNNMELAAYLCLLLSAFTVAFSLPVGRGFLAISLLVLIISLRKERKWPCIPTTAWLGFAFCLVAVCATVHGVNPALGESKLSKLLWWLGIPVAATLVSSPGRLAGVLGAYAAGAGILAIKIFIRNPFQAVASMRAGEVEDFMTGLKHIASMADPQRLMVGIIAALGFACVWREKRRGTGIWIALLVVQFVALIMTFKRGPWICTLSMVVLFIIIRMNWRWLVVIAAVVLLALCLPPVENRLANLRTEFNPDGGGRLTMWFKIAPALIEKHPWGIGWRSLTPEMMHEIAPEVEPDRNHLHSNIAEVLVETGWLGLAIYLLWMVGSLIDACLYAWAARRAPPEEAVGALVLLLTLVGLLANGLVEYNFADAEIVMAYAIVIGAIAAGRRRTASLTTDLSGVDLAK
jgi:hypothetical protein